ncbi:MAG: type VI secretion system tip protein TssI/VgrG [Myxococcales bacterium]
MATDVTVESVLGPDVFLLEHLHGREELSTPFSYAVTLLSLKSDIKLSQLLGQAMTITFQAAEDKPRYIHGHVTDMLAIGNHGGYFRYQLTLHPWIWFLSQTTNCRIFQEKTVPDILRDLLKERGIPAVDEQFTETYRVCEYTVQYRESDLNFISRLMEREGIYYFFRHEKDKHTLVLADNIGAHQPTPGWETVPYYPPNANMRRERDHIDEWSFGESVRSTQFVLNDYDFKRPRADLHAKVFAGGGYEHEDFEVYDYPGDYVEASDGARYAKVRFEEVRGQVKVAQGEGNVRGLSAGALFTLSEHPHDDQNVEHLITRTDLQLTVSGYESNQGGAPAMVRCSLRAMESSQPFRAARVTPRPVMHGPQTAKVVGKSGEEIWTDDMGRIKVQFPWDRLGKSDEKSSCWIRVAQTMAGAGWGSMNLPRIGHEVVVAFLEGDPDRPLITGCVYNGVNNVPFGLPDGGMVSGMKSDSTPGGGGNNEISLNDTKGKEMISIHGQFDMVTTIDHDQTLTVHNNRTSTVDVDDTESVGANQTLSVGADQSLSVGANQKIDVTTNQTVSIGVDASLTIGNNSTEEVGTQKSLSIGALYDVSVGAAMNLSVGAALSEEVGGFKKVAVGASSSEDVTGGKSVSAKKISESAKEDIALKAGKKIVLESGDDFGLNGKKKGVIEIADELTIKVGSAQITLKKNGDITLKGNKITLKGDSDLVVKGSKVKHN